MTMKASDMLGSAKKKAKAPAQGKSKKSKKAKKPGKPKLPPGMSPKELEAMAKSMRVVPVTYPKPDPKNPRKHGPRNKLAIQTSLKRHGQVQPILVDKKTRYVISGHGTLQALEYLGVDNVLILEIDRDEKSRTQLRDLMNRTAELADWDFELLAEAFKSYGDESELKLLGWEKYEIDPILAAEWRPPPIDDKLDLGDRPPKAGKGLNLTDEQREVVDRAVKKVRKSEGDSKMSEGRCVELICADYLA